MSKLTDFDPDKDAIDLSFSLRHTRILCEVVEEALSAKRAYQLALFEAGDVAGMAANETRVVDLEEIHQEIYFCQQAVVADDADG
jgi:hypothetical protein